MIKGEKAGSKDMEEVGGGAVHEFWFELERSSLLTLTSFSPDCAEEFGYPRLLQMLSDLKHWSLFLLVFVMAVVVIQGLNIQSPSHILTYLSIYIDM